MISRLVLVLWVWNERSPRGRPITLERVLWGE